MLQHTVRRLRDDLSMAIWRDSGLEQLFGMALDEASLTETALQRLIDLQARESEQLDFKMFGGYGPTPPSPNNPWTLEQEFCKDVFGFANHRGGVIVLGMREVDEVAVELRPQSIGTADAERQRLYLALRNNGAPWVDVAIEAVSASAGGFYLVIVVPPSLAAPHGVLGDRGRLSLRFPVRKGTHTDFMPEGQVASSYAERAVGAERAERRHRGVYDVGLEALNETEGIWVTVAVSPALAASGTLSANFAQRAEQWLGQNEIGTPCGRRLLPTWIRVASPGRVTFRARSSLTALGREEVTPPLFGYAELHVNGGVFVASAAAHNATEEFDVGHVSEIQLVDGLVTMIDVALRWAAHRSGEYGVVHIIVGFHGCRDDGLFDVPLALTEPRGGGALQQKPRTRRLVKSHSTTLVADLSTTTSVQTRLAVTYEAAAALLQQFGIEEPAQLRADGAVLARQWGDNYTSVRRWAQDHDVACEVMRGHGGSPLEFTM